MPALEKAYSILDTGGYLCFDVPQGERNPTRYINSTAGMYVKNYTKPELQNLLQEAGYTNILIKEEQGFAPNQLGWFVGGQKI